tara:strand:+ start:55621 stop:56526 length:906 start_codon:yes stop_codon:yes gene_type:complete
MRFIITVFSIALIFSCAEQKNTLPTLEGVWKRIGQVKFENSMPIDTIFYPKDSITNTRTGKNSPGTRYKIYGGGHSIWFTGALKKDSLGLFSIPNGNFGKTTFSFTKDSIFESFNFWHDRNDGNSWVKNMKDGEIHYKAKYIFDGNRYLQYGLRKDGTGGGELYERIGDYNINPTKLTGNWKRDYHVSVSNKKIGDTTRRDESFKSGNAAFLSFADNKRFVAYNIKYLDSLGNDIFPGRALLSDYEIRGDSLFEKIILRTDLKFTNTERVRKIDISGDVLKIFNINAEGNGRIVHFNRQSK